MSGHTYNLNIGGAHFEDGAHIMGILNVTPDSFYGASRVGADIVERARRMLADGAEVLDVGGQSTRPGAAPVSPLEEMARIIPAVRSIKRELCGALVSVDTFYAQVAEAAIDEGADMINDVSGLMDGELVKVVAKSGCAILCMHNRRRSTQPDLMQDKQLGLQRMIEELLDAGVDSSRILLDGGIGFNKSADEDWQLLRNYGNLIDLFCEYPFAIGTSRKSMFGGVAEGRLSATLDSTALAKKQGVMFFRVHDVAENAAVLKIR